MRIVEKAQLMSAPEIDRTLQRLAHEIVEKSGGTKHLALIGIRRRGVPLAQRIAQAMRGIDGVEVPVGTLDITLYRGAAAGDRQRGESRAGRSGRTVTNSGNPAPVHLEVLRLSSSDSLRMTTPGQMAPDPE